MVLRNLHRRSRPFRYLSFWAMAAVVLLLLGGPRPALQVLPVALFCLIWPPAVDWWYRRRSFGPDGDARHVVRTHLLECLLCGLAFGWLSLPPAGAFASTLALLSGVTAQAGWQLLCAAVPFIGAGLAAGLLAAPVWTLASSSGADLAALLFALVFTVALADVGFRQAQRLHERQRSALGRARRLESVTVRMEPYLVPSLRARIRGAGDLFSTRRDRLWITVVFVDLVGFTRLAARIDAETVATMLDEYLTEASELALRQGGEVTKVLGDGLLVSFGLDGPTERRALAAGAVHFCGELPALITRLRGDWRARGDIIELQMRAGIASGICTVGDWGGPGYRDFTMIGTPVNLASRLQACAPTDGVLLDEATAALVEDDAVLGTPIALEVRGLGTVLARLLDTKPCG